MIDDAVTILSVVSLPCGIVTGVLLVLAWRAIEKNQSRIDRRNIRMAFATSVLSVAVMATLVAVMAPLAWRAVQGSGSPHPVLVIYCLVVVIAFGILVFSAHTVRRSLAESKRDRD